MSTRHVAVLDVGKTNVKAVLVDLDGGRETAVLAEPNRVRTDGPYPHFDEPAIWTFLLGALRAFAAAGPIDAIAVTTHGAAGALIAGDRLALPLLDYEHAGIDETGAAYDAIRPPFAESCSPRLPGGLNLGAQLFHQKTRFPDAFDRVTAVVTYPQYWGWRLTGVLACDVTSLGCHTDLWAPGAGRPSGLVDRLGLAGRLAPVRSPFDRLGGLTTEIAERTGLPAGLPVQVGIHDSNASLLPHLLADEPPFAVVSTGTWTILFAVGSALPPLDPTRDTLANVDAFGRPVPSARFMGGREYELLTGGSGAVPDPADVARVLAAEAMALPGFVPGCGPFPLGAGRWTVDPTTLSPGERAAVAGLYVALMTAEALALIGADGPLIVEGPFSGNPLILSALAAVTDRPVHPSLGRTGTSVGAALLARRPERRPSAVPTRCAAVAPLPGLAAYARRWRALAGAG